MLGTVASYMQVARGRQCCCIREHAEPDETALHRAAAMPACLKAHLPGRPCPGERSVEILFVKSSCTCMLASQETDEAMQPQLACSSIYLGVQLAGYMVNFWPINVGG